MENSIICLNDLTEKIATSKGLAIYFYNNIENTNRFLQKYEELARRIKEINPKERKIFVAVNAYNNTEIRELYNEITSYPCLYIYYKGDQKAAIELKEEMDLEDQININLKTPELKA
jgi:glycerophosphoryl diester phosphodiesterase